MEIKLSHANFARAEAWAVLAMENKSHKTYGPNDIRLRCDMGHAFYKSGQYDRAIIAFETALKIDPNSVDALSGTGNALRMKGQYGDAIDFFNQALAWDEKHVFSLARKADILRLKGQYDDALKLFDQALEFDKKHVFALAHKGETLRLKGQHDDAIGFFTQALELDKENSFALACKGEVLRQKKQYKQALFCFDAALKTEADDTWTLEQKYLALKDYGYALGCDKKNDEALNCFKQALAIKPNDLLILGYKAGVLRKKREHNQAIRLCEEILLIDSKNIYTWNVKGSALNNQGHHDQAIKCFDKTLEIDANNAYALSNKGLSLNLQGNYVEAIDCFNDALKVEPDDSWTLNRKSIALSRVKYPTPFKPLVQGYNKYFWRSNKKAAYAALVAAAEDIKQPVQEQLCRVLQNLFTLKFLEAGSVKQTSGHFKLLPAQDSAEDALLQNLLNTWRKINKKFADELSVIECLCDLYVTFYYQEGWLSADSWFVIEKADTDRVLHLLLHGQQSVYAIRLDQTKPAQFIQSIFEDFLLLLFKIKAGAAKEDKKQGVQRHFLFSEDAPELKTLMVGTLNQLWGHVFNLNVFSFRQFIDSLEKKEKEQFYALQQKQLSREYTGTYCSVLLPLLNAIPSFIEADIAAQSPTKYLLPRSDKLSTEAPSLTKDPATSQANVENFSAVLNLIGPDPLDSKPIGGVYVTRKELVDNFTRFNSYYMSDFINLLMHPLKSAHPEIHVYSTILIEQLQADDKPTERAENYAKEIVVQKERYAFIPVNVSYNPNSPESKNHWIALIIDKTGKVIFYLDPARQAVRSDVDKLKVFLAYKLNIVENPIDFQKAEKTTEILHCGVYMVEIFKAFANCIQAGKSIHYNYTVKSSNEKQEISIDAMLGTISCGLKEAVEHRKKHRVEVSQVLTKVLSSSKEEKASISLSESTHVASVKSTPNALALVKTNQDELVEFCARINVLGDKAQQAIIAFHEILLGRLESRKTTSEVMSSGFISFTEKGNWPKIKKFGWLLLKSAPIAGKVMKYSHIGCQIAGEFFGGVIDEAPWIKEVEEYLEYVKSGSKAAHAAVDFLGDYWEKFKNLNKKTDDYFRKWIDSSEVNTQREYQQFNYIFRTDQGKDALNRFVHSLMDRYVRQLQLLNTKGAKQLAKAIDRHLGRLFLLDFNQWNLPQFGAQKHKMMLEIMRQWVTYMAFLEEKQVTLASGEVTTAQTLLQYCGVHFEGDKKPIEIDVIMDWNADGTHSQSNASRYGHRKAEPLLVEEFKGHSQAGNQVLLAYQKQFVGQKTDEELEKLKELGHVMGIRFDSRTLNAFQAIQEVKACEEIMWQSHEEKIQTNEKKLNHITGIVNTVKEDVKGIKDNVEVLRKSIECKLEVSANTQKVTTPSLSQQDHSQTPMNMPEGFVLISESELSSMKTEIIKANNIAKAAEAETAEVRKDLDKSKKRIDIQDKTINNLSERLKKLEAQEMRNNQASLQNEEKFVETEVPSGEISISISSAQNISTPPQENSTVNTYYSSVLSQAPQWQNTLNSSAVRENQIGKIKETQEKKNNPGKQ
jgi:tetratricopeptide (TPR) repeat protein